MKKIIFLLMLTSMVGFAQTKSKPVKYKYGQNGIELIINKNSETIVVSTFQAKVKIKDEVAEKVYAFYKENPNKANGEITIEGITASITGIYTVKRKGKLTSVDFRYEKVEWKNGLVEVSE
jgi:hypothetical protein